MTPIEWERTGGWELWKQTIDHISILWCRKRWRDAKLEENPAKSSGESVDAFKQNKTKQKTGHASVPFVFWCHYQTIDSIYMNCVHLYSQAPWGKVLSKNLLTTLCAPSWDSWWTYLLTKTNCLIEATFSAISEFPVHLVHICSCFS